MNKREIIAKAINAGGATKESLMKVAEVNSAGLSSQFTYLRLTGQYPIIGEDGFFKFIDAEAWAALKAASASNRASAAPAKSPEERKLALDKRVAKLQDACDKKTEAFKKEASELNRLRLQKAEAEVGIALIELDAVNAELDAQQVEGSDADVEETEEGAE